MQIRKIFISIIFIFFVYAPVVMADTNSDYLSAVENSLFKTSFEKEPINSRLNRIEINTFGSIKKTSAENRMQDLKKLFGNFTAKPQSKFINAANLTKITPAKPPVFDPSISYPAVDQIELKVLNKSFPQEDIYKRLNRLETVLFGFTSNIALNDRVEKLRLTVAGNQNNDSSQALNNPSVDAVLSKLETDTFKTAYPNESIESRLSRLEMSVFNQASPDDDPESRLERLAAVISAKPSSELYQDMSKIRQYQNATAGITAATILIMILQGLLL